MKKLQERSRKIKIQDDKDSGRQRFRKVKLQEDKASER
jgi:hypothetical protein